MTISSPYSTSPTRKGYDMTQSTMRDHVRLIDQGGNLVKNKTGGATRYLGRAYLQRKG